MSQRRPAAPEPAAPKPRALPIDIRDTRLPGGRLSISSRTADPLERAVRERAIRRLLDEHGETGLELVARLKARRVRIERVAQAVASGKVAELLAEPEAAPDAVPVLLGATVDRFLADVEGRHARPNTLDHYRTVCAQLERAFGVERMSGGKIRRDVEIAGVGEPAARAWLRGPQPTNGGRAWSARKQAVVVAVARQVWEMAIAEDEERHERRGTPRTLTRQIWGSRKAGRVAAPKIRRTRVRFLSRAEAGRALWAARGRPAALLLALGLYAGLRASEATHLRVEVDVDLDAGVLRIQPHGSAREAWRPKSDHSIRDVPLHPRLARWIRAHQRAGYAGAHYLLRAAGRDRPLDPNTVQAWTRDAFLRAGIAYGRTGTGATNHTLRHTFASWLAQKDVQLKKIALLIGDRTEMVDRTYSHLLPTDLAAAVRLLP